MNGECPGPRSTFTLHSSPFTLHSPELHHLRKDVTIATVAAAVILGVCYLLNVTRPPFKARASKPYALALSPGTAGNEKVVMRIHGDPVTEAQFSEPFRQLPPHAQPPFPPTTGPQ